MKKSIKTLLLGLAMLFSLAVTAAAQNALTIKGKVTSSDGEPMVGCVVYVKGQQNALNAITNLDGDFIIKEVPVGSTLVAEYLGYLPETVKVTVKSTSVSIVMKEDSSALDEVVVVGYGTQKKGLLTASVSTIKNDDILTTTSTDLNSRLQGKVAGLQIRQNSGEPGTDDFSINVRGFGEPIFILDGTERITAAEFNRLNPEEIDNISVLKDGSAAVYGMNAGNGVILVTTKKGEKGKLRLDFKGTVSVNSPTEMPTMMNSVQYMTMRNEASWNVGGSEVYSSDLIEKYRNGTLKDTDWYGATMKNSTVNQIYSISAQGGSDKVHFFTSLGYTNEPGLLKSNAMNYQRLNFRSNVTVDFSKRATLEVQVGSEYNTRNASASSIFNIMRGTVSTLPMHTIYANNNPDYYNYTYDGQAFNPVAQADGDTYGTTSNRGKAMTARAVLTYKPLKVPGLKFKAVGQYRSVDNHSTTTRKAFYWYTYNEDTDSYEGQLQNSPTYMQSSWSDYNTLTLQAQAIYDHLFGNHHVGATLVYEQRSLWNSFGTEKRNFSNFVLGQINYGDVDDQTTTGYDTNEGYQSVIGKFSYDYKGKYMAEVDFRYDGSYRYNPEHRWGFFPVFQLGWRVSQEKWFQEAVPVISNLKLRASYGTVGEDAGSAYQYMAGYTLGSGGYRFSDDTWTSGAKLNDIVNENLTWYVSKMMDFGVDLAFFNNELKLEADIYRRNRSGLLSTRAKTLPDTFGGTLPQENLNSDRTDGVEFSIGYNKKLNKDWSINASANFNFARTKNIYLEQTDYPTSYSQWRNDKTGRWSDIIWVYDCIGQFKTQEEINTSPLQDGTQGNSKTLPGDFKYRDVNGDGIIDTNDMVPESWNGTPKMHYGLTLGAKWRDLDFNILFQGSAKYTIYITHNYAMMFWNDGNMPAYFYDRWHKEDYNDPNSAWVEGRWPAARTTNDAPSLMYAQSNIWRRDASYLRIKSVELGYNLPKKWLKPLNIKNVRIYANGYNLFTFCDEFVKAFDPEKSEGSNNAGWVYPLTKSFNAGINITF